MRGRAVVPAALQPPDIVHDKLRLVVDRLQIRFFGECSWRLDLIDYLAERRAFALAHRNGPTFHANTNVQEFQAVIAHGQG